jgi:DNA-binding response OmpR family regulator
MMAESTIRKPQIDASVWMMGSPSAAIRLLWLQDLSRDQVKHQSLLHKFVQQGAAVHVLPLDATTQAAWAEQIPPEMHDPHLILVGAAGLSRDEVDALLTQIRTHSHVPILLLTDTQTIDWSIATLTAGADAVVGLNTPDEVIIARGLALVRRWWP